MIQLTKSRRLCLLIAVGLQMIILNLDMTTVNVAIPTLTQALNLTFHVASSLITLYIAVGGALLLLGAQLANRFTAKRMFVVSSLVFLLGSILCSVASNGVDIVVGRIIQGIGMGLSLTIIAPLLFAMYQSEEHMWVMGVLVLFTGVPQALGPTIAAWLISAWSWRWIFLINIPLGVVSLVLVMWFYPAQQALIKKLAHKRSLLLFLVAVMAFVGLMTELSHPSASIVLCALLMLLTLLSGGYFLYCQRRNSALLDLRVCAQPVFKVHAGVRLLFQYSFYTTMFVMVLYMHRIMGFSVAKTGMYLAVQTAMFGFLSPLFARTAKHLGIARQLFFAMVLAGVSALLLALFAGLVSQAIVILALLSNGLAAAMIMPLTIPCALGVVPDRQKQVQASWLYALMLIGSMSGVGISSVVLRAVSGYYLDVKGIISPNLHHLAVGLGSTAGLPTAMQHLVMQSFVHGFTGVYVVCVIVQIAAAICVARTWRALG